mgnify:CR=1 FL=1
MTFPQLDNPWFWGHNQENQADPLDLNWPDDDDNLNLKDQLYFFDCAPKTKDYLVVGTSPILKLRKLLH